MNLDTHHPRNDSTDASTRALLDEASRPLQCLDDDLVRLDELIETSLNAPQRITSSDVDDSLIGIVDDQDIPSKYIAIFIDESEQTLDEISEHLLAPDDQGAVPKLLTACHRLKGSAASIGLHRIAHVAHRMEDLLQDLPIGQSIQGQLTDALLGNIDALRAFVTGLKDGASNDCLDASYQLLLAIAHEFQPSLIATQSQHINDGSRPDWSTVLAAAPADQTGFAGHVVFEPNVPLVTLKCSLLLEKLSHIGEVFFSRPTAKELDEQATLEDFMFGVATEHDEAMLRAALTVQGVQELLLRPTISETLPKFSDAVQVTPSQAIPFSPPQVAALAETTDAHEIVGTTTDIERMPETAAANCSGANTNAAKDKPAETMRVAIDRLDQLMSLSGQLTINKARFAQIGRHFKEKSNFKPTLQWISSANATASRIFSTVEEAAVNFSRLDTDVLRTLANKMCDDLALVQRELNELSKLRGTVNELTDAVHQFGRVSDSLQATVMGTRMAPIGPLFARFKRVIRDLERGHDKRIDLRFSGENTELDKRMIDELGDPLIHMIRNSADHGIEPIDQRIAAGKLAQGTIALNAFHRGNRIIIQIIDDGRGLDADRIRNKAVADGLISTAEAARMTRQQLYQMIWKSGFSTADRVTEVSGRGMGMDIALSKIQQLNGNIDVLSEPGQGTRFEITLPLTMAIVPSLLTLIKGDVFAIPVESILEIVQFPTRSLPTVQGKVTARVRDRVIAVVELAELLESSDRHEFTKEAPTVTTLVIVGHEGNELALVVDNLLGEQDVVIKSIEENFRNVDGIAGASILGDGRVSLILDVSALLTIARAQAESEVYQREPIQ